MIKGIEEDVKNTNEYQWRLKALSDHKVAILLENLSSQFKVFMVKPALVKINNRLDTIKGEIVKINPESRAVFVKQAK